MYVVVASLVVSRYEKAHPRAKNVIFIYFCWLLLTSYGFHRKKKIGHFCSGITRLHKRLDVSRVASHYTSEVDFSE